MRKNRAIRAVLMAVAVTAAIAVPATAANATTVRPNVNIEHYEGHFADLAGCNAAGYNIFDQGAEGWRCLPSGGGYDLYSIWA